MVAIRRLTPVEYNKYRDHLLRLNDDDRRLRFGYISRDESINSYIETLSPTKDVIFAHFDENLNVIGAAHVALTEMNDEKVIELGVSVEWTLRGKGIGHQLFDKAVEWGENRGIKQLFTQCVADNRAMMKMAKAHGMKIHSECGEAEAFLELDKHIPVFQHEVFDESMAWLDYGVKSQLKFVKSMTDLLNFH